MEILRNYKNAKLWRQIFIERIPRTELTDSKYIQHAAMRPKQKLLSSKAHEKCLIDIICQNTVRKTTTITFVYARQSVKVLATDHSSRCARRDRTEMKSTKEKKVKNDRVFCSLRPFIYILMYIFTCVH